MNILRGLFLSIFLWLGLTLACGIGQTPSYNFQSDTVWGKVTALVTDLQDHFQIEVQSDTAATRWMLKDVKSHKIAQGTLDAANHMKAQIPFPFTKPFQLVLLLKSDQGETPV